MPVDFGVNEHLAEIKVKFKPIVKIQRDVGYYFRIYYTCSESQPVVWSHYDGSSFIKDAADTYEWAKGIGSTIKGATGYKIVCLWVDMLNSSDFVPEFVPEYCMEKWEPPYKVYINGPKKSFLAKKGNHYVGN